MLAVFPRRLLRFDVFTGVIEVRGREGKTMLTVSRYDPIESNCIEGDFLCQN